MWPEVDSAIILSNFRLNPHHIRKRGGQQCHVTSTRFILVVLDIFLSCAYEAVPQHTLAPKAAKAPKAPTLVLDG